MSFPWRTASLVLSLLPSAASAQTTPPRAERTLTITLTERTSLVWALRLSPSELARVRAAADADHDGTVSAAEANKLLDAWTQELRAKVSIAAGRDRVGYTFPLEVKAIHRGREAVGLEGPIAETKVEARFSWAFDLRLGGGDDRLDVLDESNLVPLDRSEVIVHDSPARKLLGLAVDADAPTASGQLSWADHDKKRTVHVTWAKPPERPWWMVPTVIVVGLAIAVLTIRSVSK